MSQRCSACNSAVLLPHLRVTPAGDAALVPSTDRYGSALADIVRCPACSHMQLERFPAHDELGEAYGEAESSEYIAEESGQRATARVALERIERHVRPGALVDVGAWVGFLVDEAARRGWQPGGIEPSEFASRFARERLGVEVATAELATADLPEAAFDAVVLGDVIEHLVDPAGALDRIAGLLRPDGVVYLALPDAGSRVARTLGARWWSVLPTHVQYFTRASLFTLLRRRGFEPLWLGTAPKAFSVRYYLERLNGYSPAVGGGAAALASAAGLGERLWTPDFRDRMAVVARLAWRP